jgi:phosphatidylcholine synthase
MRFYAPDSNPRRKERKTAMNVLRSRVPIVRAYAVHFYTSLGLVAGLLAMMAVAEGRARDVFIFLVIALWIDGTDGMLARGWEVVVWTPRFDGRKLDDITDYLNYTFIPVFFIYHFQLVTGIWILSLPLVLLASVYGFCQKAAKTEDGYFTGFPSYWNVLAFYFYLLGTGPAFNGLALIFCAIMVFVPIHLPVADAGAPPHQPGAGLLRLRPDPADHA